MQPPGLASYCVRPCATLNWVWWFNETRLHSGIGHVPPVEYEAAYYRHNNTQSDPASGEPSLH